MVKPSPLFIGFFYVLKEYDIPISMQYMLDFYAGLEKGLVRNLDELFIFLRLNFVKKAEHMDAFERAFAFYFFDIDIPNVSEGDTALFDTLQFQEWLRKAVQNKDIPQNFWNMSRDELLKKFWETLREQMERHDGGSKWVGTGGSSPFGHSGAAQPGVRVHGPGGNRSAIKAIGERNYIDYAATNALQGTNIRQALVALKALKPSGAYTELDIAATIKKTAVNGGEIEFVFERELRDKLSVTLLIDNGGMSMLPYVDLTRLLFDKLKDRFKELNTYYFHNTIYGHVFEDSQHNKRINTEKILQKSAETRVIMIGDASMAPAELVSQYGNRYFYDQDSEPSIDWLKKLKERFKHVVWLNPISKERWDFAYGAWTIKQIRSVFQMEDLTLNGIKKAVDYLNKT